MAKTKPRLYSDGYEVAKTSDVPSPIRKAVEMLRSNYEVGLSIYRVNQYFVASLQLPVNLPNQGTVDGIDIQEIEPILIFFHSIRFPYETPQIRINRMDFPDDRLPHLNPVQYSEPPYLCLYRGSINDWYAEHSINDLILRAQGWLQDAAKKNLMKIHEGDRFEETRIDINQWIGMSIFDYQTVCSFIINAWKQKPMAGMAYTSNLVTFPDEPYEGIKIHAKLFTQSYSELMNYQTTMKTDMTGEVTRIQSGLILWAELERVINRYFGFLPITLKDFISFSGNIGINLPSVFSTIKLEHPEFLQQRFLPISICIQRPAKLIHQSSNLEIISFIVADPPVEGKQVFTLTHRSPLSTDMSRNLSNQKTISNKVMLIGCGALGSKIGLHLGRAGITDLTLVDNDHLSPHNLVRHALLVDSNGKNKAIALRDAINGLYLESEGAGKVTAMMSTAFDLFSDSNVKVIKNQNFIIDATASSSVFSFLSETNLLPSSPVIRCEIANEGNIGIMLVEGRGRSPKLDDLEATLYDMAVENRILENWLRNFNQKKDDDTESELEDITVGLGCSSPTMKISDDFVSYHASALSIEIRNILSNPDNHGGILISAINKFSPFTATTNYFPVEKFKTLPLHQPNGWSIRIRPSSIQEILDKTRNTSPIETGGILIGTVNHQRKIIHITRLIDAPSDSEGYPFSFKRGVRDLPEKVVEIEEKTGRLVTYVGEWHSHPNGSVSMSKLDLDTMHQLKKQLDKINIPTIIMVATQTDCIPHLFPCR
ncbi:MAG TPA: ThiF family adenylyltransferase [Desulfosporosinus sp.]|nr:ThiF family adenylyltransferase [Desulfosporosinus sp.]